MNKQEVGKFLTLTSLIDNRQITAEVALMWSEIIGHLSLDEAVAAMREHYAETDKWLMPAHVLQRVKAKRQKALPRTMSPSGKDCTQLGRPSHRFTHDSVTCLFCEVTPEQVSGG